MGRFVRLLVVLVLASACQVSACLAAEPEEPKPAPMPTGKTPEEAFAQIREAIIKEDWETALVCMTAEGREAIVGACLAMISLRVPESSGKELAEKFAPAEKLREVMAKVETVFKLKGKAKKEDTDALRHELTELVEDQAGFMQAVTKEFEDHKLFREAWFVHVEKQELEDVEVDGENAKAKLHHTFENGASGYEPMTFRRKDGIWLLDYRG